MSKIVYILLFLIGLNLLGVYTLPDRYAQPIMNSEQGRPLIASATHLQRNPRNPHERTFHKMLSKMPDLDYQNLGQRRRANNRRFERPQSAPPKDVFYWSPFANKNFRMEDERRQLNDLSQFNNELEKELKKPFVATPEENSRSVVNTRDVEQDEDNPEFEKSVDSIIHNKISAIRNDVNAEPSTATIKRDDADQLSTNEKKLGNSTSAKVECEKEQPVYDSNDDSDEEYDIDELPSCEKKEPEPSSGNEGKKMNGQNEKLHNQPRFNVRGHPNWRESMRGMKKTTHDAQKGERMDHQDGDDDYEDGKVVKEARNAESEEYEDNEIDELVQEIIGKDKRNHRAPFRERENDYQYLDEGQYDQNDEQSEDDQYYDQDLRMQNDQLDSGDEDDRHLGEAVDAVRRLREGKTSYRRYLPRGNRVRMKRTVYDNGASGAFDQHLIDLENSFPNYQSIVDMNEGVNGEHHRVKRF